jgi:alkylhydroperoxidase family enzyme
VPTHITLGRSVGLTEAKLAGLAALEPSEHEYSPVERTVIMYARRLTTGAAIDDDLYAELRRHFTLPQLVELCCTIGIANVINRFHATFHTPLDERTRAGLTAGSPLPLPEEPGAGS